MALANVIAPPFGYEVKEVYNGTPSFTSGQAFISLSNFPTGFIPLGIYFSGEYPATMSLTPTSLLVLLPLSPGYSGTGFTVVITGLVPT